jgi:hypothetical protein
MADLIGETRFLATSGRHISSLTEIRATALVQLIVAGIGLMLAIASASRLHDDDDPDDEVVVPADPLWVRGIAGAALIVGVVAVALCAVALAYSLTSTAGSPFSFTG